MTSGPAQIVLDLSDELIGAIATRAAGLLAGSIATAPESWIGADDAADHLSCPRSRIYRLVSQARGGRQPNPIPFEKDGARLLFRRPDLDAWVRRGGADG